MLNRYPATKFPHVRDDGDSNADPRTILDCDQMRICGFENHVLTDEHILPNVDSASAVQHHS
jgi:hypothetical protein